jgi:hypothetical protein
MPLVPVSEEEAARLNQPAMEPVRLVPVPPVNLTPVNPLDDFAAYNAVEDEKEARGYDPDDPGIAAKVWNGVKGVVQAVPAAARALVTLNNTPMNPAASAALLAQTAGKVLGNYNVLGQGAKTIAQKAKAATVALMDPARAAEMKQLSRQAAWQFQREARDTEEFTNHFTQHLETIFPQALKGLGSVPVDNEAAGGFAMLADPANWVPAGAAARWTTQVPLRGAVRAAETAVKEAALAAAEATAKRESLTLLLKPGLSAAERGPLFARYQAADGALKTAAKQKDVAAKALARVTAEQRAVVDRLGSEAAQLPLVTRGAAQAAQGLGSAADFAGRQLQVAAKLPEVLAARIAGGADAEAAKSIAEGVRTAVGLGGVVPATAGAVGVGLSRAGAAAQTYGRLLLEAESQLPFFKRLARETKGLTSWGASLVDQSGLGQLVTPITRMGAEATRGVPFAAALGAVQSGGTQDGALQGAGGGLVFGMAGAGYGQWRRFASGQAFRLARSGDIGRYRQTLPTEEARSFYDKLPGADRAALATMQLAHPDLRIQYSDLGKGRPSFYYAAEDGPVAVINLATRDPVAAVLAHEIGHHVEKHGLDGTVQRVLFGDPLLEQAGLFTRRSADGAPVRREDGGYAKTPEWDALKGAYNERIKALADRTGETLPARDDAAIAREVFAEHVADYLMSKDGGLRSDLRSNVWTRALGALGESSLAGSMPMLRQVVGKFGIPLTGSERRVVGSNLFPGGLEASPELARVIRKYHQASARDRQPRMEEEKGGTRYAIEEVVQHPEILDKLFDGSDDVKRDGAGRVLRDKYGRPQFTTAAEQKTERAALATAIGQWIERHQPDGTRYERIVNPKTGRVEEGWLSAGLPDAMIDDLKAGGRFNPTQLEHLRTGSGLIKAGQGKSALFFYQPALNGRKHYASLAGDWRTETPYALFISKAGNVLMRTMSREKLTANAQELVAKGRAGAWNNSLPALMQDVDRYLANHAAGKPGSDGIGVEKRDQINALFGIGTKANMAANPLLESSPRSPIVIRSRRIDRINRMTPVEEFFPTNYDKLNRNLRPEAKGGSGAAGLGWEGVRKGQDFNVVKKYIPKSPSPAPRLDFAGKDSAEAMKSIRDFLMEHPVVTAFDGTRILIANPQGRGDGLLNRAEHLAGRRRQSMSSGARDFDYDKASLVAAIPETLRYGALKVEQRGEHLYFRRYKDGLLHMVIVDPHGFISDHGAVDGAVVTQYAPKPKTRFEGARVLSKGEL